ncbi:MAG: NAD(P)-dependent alcohol dehydrogenase [Phycisphaeraceae bacterium]|nr:NAD(P)-dependent alcohol dehydrogenase [Phycisphaeraceae bacterium]
MSIRAYAAHAPTTPLVPFAISRREPRPTDVDIEILYCGVCHSDLHFARNEWGMTTFPVVPGHEILGRVTRVGGSVTKVRPGDLAAVGCMVDACRTCEPCQRGLEQFCLNGAIFTYNGEDRHSGGLTYGGYSQRIVVDEAFTLRVPAGLDPAGAAPLLCAGITTYSPLRRWNAGKGRKVGVVGLGGLGHMGVRFAHAFGAHTVLFTTSPGKAEDGRRLGADEVVMSRDADAMARHAGSFDVILDTVSADHDINAYLSLLRLDGTLVLVGAPPAPLALSAFSVLFPRRQVVGSLIGGIAETQEMLDFCGAHRITCDVELIRMDQINDAYERLLRSDVRYRFVIDMASLAE